MEQEYLLNQTNTIVDIKLKLNPVKNSGAFIVIQITKDVLKDPTKLLLAAECKQRSRRIKQTYAKFTRYMPRGGKHKKKTKRTKQKTKKLRNRITF